jgi:hypothetical protein
LRPLGLQKRVKKNAAETQEMIDLIEQHAQEYPDHNAADRLAQVELTPPAYRRLCKGSHERTVRESAIPEGDVEAAIKFFIAHPDVGAGKAHVSLIDYETAYMSTANLNVVKQELTHMAEEEYKKRKEEQKILEAQLRKDLLARQKNPDYHHLRAEYPNHIWAIDFVNISFLGMQFAFCAIYDEFSQAYLSLRAGFLAVHQLAAACMEEALRRAPRKPKFMRRDNGKPFLTEHFQQQLATVHDYPIPPHSPWFNGSLESCNTSLKAAVKTTGMQDMAHNSGPYRFARQYPDIALDALQQLADRVRSMLNKDISRRKHDMPPHNVFSGQHQATRERHQVFVAKKRQARRERMATIRASPDANQAPKNLLGKIQSLAKRLIGKMDTNALYVLNEVLHHRFRMFET